MCGPGGGRGSLLTQQGACPAAHARRPPGRDAAGLSYFWNLNGQPCVPACDERCHLRVGVDGAPAPRDTVTPGLLSEARSPLPAARLPPSPGDAGAWWGHGTREPKPPWPVFPAEAPRPSVLLFPRTRWWHLLCRSVRRGRLSLRAPPGSVGSSRPSVAPGPPLLLREPALPAPLRAPWGMCSEAQLFTSFLSTAAFPEPSSLTG